MDFKNNTKYFKQTTLPIYVGIGLAILGILMYFIFKNERSWELRQLCYMLMFAGAVVIVMFLIIRPKDDDLKEEIRKRTVSNSDTAQNMVQEADKHCKIVECYEGGAHDYSGKDGMLFRRGNDGTVRSSEYSSCVIVVTNKRLYIYRHDFSLTGD